jgi:hypothetical protein
MSPTQVPAVAANPQVAVLAGGEAGSAIDAAERRRKQQADDVAATGAPRGPVAFVGAALARMFGDPDAMMSAVVSNQSGRLLNWLIDEDDPAYDQPLRLNGGPGGFIPANGKNAMSSFQMQQMRPRIGVFRRDPSTFVRLLPNHNPPAAAARVAQYPNTGSPGRKWASTVLPPPVLGRRVIRWPRTFPDFPTFSGRDPNA